MIRDVVRTSVSVTGSVRSDAAAWNETAAAFNGHDVPCTTCRARSLKQPPVRSPRRLILESGPLGYSG